LFFVYSIFKEKQTREPVKIFQLLAKKSYFNASNFGAFKKTDEVCQASNWRHGLVSNNEKTAFGGLFRRLKSKTFGRITEKNRA